MPDDNITIMEEMSYEMSGKHVTDFLCGTYFGNLVILS